MYKLLAVFSFILLLFSCNSVDTNTIAEIKKWEEKLDSAHQVFLETDFDSIKIIAWTTTENEKAVKHLNTADTIYHEMARMLDDYKWIRKNLKNVDSKKLEYETEFEELKIQLKNLKLDVANGVRTSEENNQYLSNEVMAIKNLFSKFSWDHKIFTKAQDEFARLKVPVQEYVDQLKRDKGIIK